MDFALITLGTVFASAYLVLGLILYLMQPKFLYRPEREVNCTPGSIGLDFEEVFFDTCDGLKLNGWYVPAAGRQPTVLFCHGNGGNIMHRLDSVNLFFELGLSCFVFDYRGYGLSQGSPSEEGTYRDAEAAYRWLTEEKKKKPQEIIIFGRSLGASIAAQLASKVEAAALVLESGFTCYVEMGKRLYPYMPVKWFARFRYETIKYIRLVQCPVMVVHSREDDIVPFEFAKRLYEAANEPKKFVEIYGGHNDGFLASREIYERAWQEFLTVLSARKKIFG